MKKITVLILMMWCAGYSLNPFTYNWTIKLTGDTATVAKWRANNDSVLNWSVKVSDTFRVVPRWSAFRNHDSTFKWMNIDTIPSADTINVANLKATKLDAGTGTFTGMINVNDSIYTTKGIKTTGITAGTYSSFTCDSGTVICTLSVLNSVWGSSSFGDTIGVLHYSAVGNICSFFITGLNFIDSITTNDGGLVIKNFPSRINKKNNVNYVDVNVEEGGYTTKRWSLWFVETGICPRLVSSSPGTKSTFVGIYGTYLMW